MGGSKHIRIWVALGFILALTAMGMLGWEAYRSVEQLAYNLDAASTPDEELRQVKEISNTLTSMESSVRAFAITGNADLLEPYYQGATGLTRQIKTLRKLTPLSAQSRKIINLISDKTQVLDDLVVMADDGSAGTAFDKFVTQMEELPAGVERPRTYADTVRVKVVDSVVVRTTNKDKPKVKEDEKKGFFRSVFGSRKKAATPETPPTPAPKPERKINRTVAVDTLGGSVIESVDPSRKLVTTLKAQADSFQLMAAQDAQLLVDTILVLATRDIRLSQKIAEQVHILETLRQADSRGLSAASTERAAYTIRFIGIFGVIVVVIFSVLLAIILNDIRRNQQLQAFLREEKLKTEELSKAKEAFLNTISHDLRTPMHAVIGFSEQLGKTALSQKQAWYHRHIQQASAYLLALLNDVLDYAKMQSPGFTLEQIPFSPEAVANEAAALFQERIKEKGLQWELILSPDLPKAVLGDPLRLRQVLFNLLSNAVKFTDKGKIELLVLSHALNKEVQRVKFVVKDTGIGVPTEKMERIFVAFGQADASTGRRYGGTGLGLSITRQLIEMQGGTVEFQSSPGVGTTVTCTLPYALASVEQLTAPSQEENTPVSAGFLLGKKVLIADDESFNRALLSEILAGWGLEVVVVENGKEALGEVENQAFDFILLDLHMPEMDGVTATRAIRALTGVPIVGLTAALQPDEEMAAKVAGMNAVLLKPFKENELLAMLRTDVIPETNSASDMPQAPLPESQPFFDDRYLSLKQSGNPAFVHRMLSLFVENGKQYLAGMEASRLAYDPAALGEFAHKWLPACRHLGLSEVVTVLAGLEHEALHGSSPERVLQQFDQQKALFYASIEGVEKDLTSLT